MIETIAGQFTPATKRTITVQHAVFDGHPSTAKAIAIYARERGAEIIYHPPVRERIDGSDETREVAPPHLEIVTLEGRMIADVGDVVIEGVKSEFYPCKPDIFEQTYTVGDVTEDDVAERPVNIAVHQAADNWPAWMAVGLGLVLVVGQGIAIGLLLARS